MRDADVASGARLLAAFRCGATGSAEPGQMLIGPEVENTRVYQLRSGFAYRSREIGRARRAIVDLFLPGDVIGLEAIFQARLSGTVAAAAATRYWAVEAAALRDLMQNDAAVALGVGDLLFEAQQRASALALQIGRLDARERIACLLLDVFGRLRRQGLINRPAFKLRLTQQQIGDHVGLSGVHVNRVVRWLAREGIAIVERQAVVIKDIGRLRALARGELPIKLKMPQRQSVGHELTDLVPPAADSWL